MSFFGGSAGISPNDPMPLYYQVYSSLVQRIGAGEFAPGEILPSERQLVEEYGVSRITIIKALDLMEREGRIERHAGRGSFVAHPAGQAGESAPTKTRTLAFVCSDLSKPYLQSILSGIVGVATQNNYQIQVMGLYNNPVDEAHAITDAVEGGLDGLIIYPSPGFEQAVLYSELQNTGFPLVMVDRYYPQIETPRVVFDNEDASFHLTRYLIEKGHQRIAVLPYFEREVTSVRDRLRGYRRALEDHGIAYEEDLIWLDVYPTLLQAEGRPIEVQAARKRLRAHLENDKPTVLLALNYEVAERFFFDLAAINAQRLREAVAHQKTPLPDDLALEIATFSYGPASVYTPYQFTVAMQPGETLGAEAARLLIERLEGKVTERERFLKIPIRLPEHLIVPSSSGLPEGVSGKG